MSDPLPGNAPDTIACALSDAPLTRAQIISLLVLPKVLAVARLLKRRTHIPATTALGILDGRGRIKAFQAGANVVMPDFTPPSFRQYYGIYPGRSDPQNVHDFLCRLGRRSAAAANHRTGKRWKNQA